MAYHAESRRDTLTGDESPSAEFESFLAQVPAPAVVTDPVFDAEPAFA